MIRPFFRVTNPRGLIKSSMLRRPCFGGADVLSASAYIGMPLLICRKKSHIPNIGANEIMRWQASTGSLIMPSEDQKEELLMAKDFFSQSHDFLYSAASLYQHVPNHHTPEVVVVGASNVGKSSFLNALMGQSGMARVSHRPGKTTMMNAYGVGPPPEKGSTLVPKGHAAPKHSLIVVDTPGYGYKSQATWGEFILSYLEQRHMLRGAVLLLSSEKRLLPEDKWMLRALAESNTRTLVILTKADKGGAEWASKCNAMAESLHEEMQRLEVRLNNGWRREGGWSPHIYVTAATMNNSVKTGNGGGLGGARLAILDIAGFSLKASVELKPESVTYAGPIVSFDDIKWAN